jgi:hypothetical protein
MQQNKDQTNSSSSWDIDPISKCETKQYSNFINEKLQSNQNPKPVPSPTRNYNQNLIDFDEARDRLGAPLGQVFVFVNELAERQTAVEGLLEAAKQLL